MTDNRASHQGRHRFTNSCTAAAATVACARMSPKSICIRNRWHTEHKFKLPFRRHLSPLPTLSSETYLVRKNLVPLVLVISMLAEHIRDLPTVSRATVRRNLPCLCWIVGTPANDKGPCQQRTSLHQKREQFRCCDTKLSSSTTRENHRCVSRQDSHFERNLCSECSIRRTCTASPSRSAHLYGSSGYG